jgi:hypothetical protein
VPLTASHGVSSTVNLGFGSAPPIDDVATRPISIAQLIPKEADTSHCRGGFDQKYLGRLGWSAEAN